MQKAVADAEQRQSELSALQREHRQAKNLHAAAQKEVEALHMGHASAAKRAEESIAELALFRETQAALTAQARPSKIICCCLMAFSNSSIAAADLRLQQQIAQQQTVDIHSSA